MKDKKKLQCSQMRLKRLLLLWLVSAVLLPSQAMAGFSRPVKTQEVGVYPLSEATTNPTDFYLVEGEAPIDYKTQLSAIFYCTAQRQLYFAGVKLVYGADFELEFGDLAAVQASEPDVQCETLQVDQWVTGIEYYTNSQLGVLGFSMFGHNGATYRAAALGSGQFTTSGRIDFSGPPIGMNMLFTDAPGNGGSWDPRPDTPFAIQTIIDSEVCDFSFYLGGQGPRDMNTESVSGAPDIQVVVNQDNFITGIYGQDCGKTTAKFAKNQPFMFLSTDPVTGVHTIKLESKVNQIGLYDMKLILTNSDPFILMKPIEYEFQVYIHPCKLDDLIITPPEDIVLTIGDPDLYRDYSWEQVPDCQYPVSVDFVSNQNPSPTYMIHEIDNERIYFPMTQDLSFAGDYPDAEVVVRVYVDTNYTRIEADVVPYYDNFSIRIIDPCPDSEFVPFTVLDEQIRVFVDVKQRQLATPQDTVSLNIVPDGVSFCGPRVYKFEVPSLVDQKVVQFDPDTMMITFQSNKLEEVGEHNVYLTVAIEKYSLVRTQVRFKLTILACEIKTFTAVAQLDQEYNVFTGPMAFTLLSFEQEPACEYSIDYTYKVISPASAAGALPQFITVSDKLTMTVESNDIAHVNDYLIEVHGKVVENPDATIVNYLEKKNFFTLRLVNGCIEDVIEPITYGIPENDQYVIGTDTTKSISLAWYQDRVGCPFELEFTMVDTVTGKERAMTGLETASLAYDKDLANLQAIIRLNTITDFSLDGETWSMKASLRSLHSEQTVARYTIPVDPSVSVVAGTALSPATSGSSGSYEVSFTFIDQCWLSDLVPGQFSFTRKEFYLHEMQSLQFSQMQDLTYGQLTCGGFTYTLEYLQGPASDMSAQGADLSHYLLFGNTFKGLVKKRQWLGTHTMHLKCSNGDKSSTLTRGRGDDQIFNSVFSDPIEIVIKDPCLETRVNLVTINSMLIRYGQTQLSQEVSGPTDTASLQFGNGYDICGPMMYTLIDELDDEVKESWMEFSYIQKFNMADQLFLSLISEPEGNQHTAKLRVKAELVDYPGAKPAYIPFDVRYWGCFYDAFTVSSIPDQTIRVRDVKRLSYSFDQTPCQYPISITTTIVDSKGNEVDSVDFITSDPLTKTLDITAMEDGLIGKYFVTVEGTIMNTLSTQAHTTFTLNIVSGDAIIIEEPEVPDLEMELFVHTQRVRIGYHDLIEYRPTMNFKNAYGYLKQPGLDFGLFRDPVANFVSYDPIRGLIVIDGKNVTRADEGEYTLRYFVTFSNATIEWDVEYNFTLLVTADELYNKADPCELDIHKCQIVDVYDWKGKTIDSSLLGLYDPAQPVPQITYISPTGLVTIEWDRDMQVVSPLDLDEIAIQKIGLRDYTFHDSFGVGFGLSKQELNQVAEAGARRLEAEQSSKKVKIVDALELSVKPRDRDFDPNEEVKFSWTFERFEARRMQLQLYIEDPSQLSKAGQLDSLFVTFFDTSYFKAADSGVEVRQNTVLSWDLFRMITESEQETVHDLKFFYYLTIGTLVLSIPMTAYGSLLPTWMFVHSLQIVAHTPLLNSEMPGNVQYFMADYLKIVRLRDPVFDKPAPRMASTLGEDAMDVAQRLLQSLQSMTGSGQIPDDQVDYEEDGASYHGAYNNRFLTNGYAQLLGINLVVFLYLGLAVVLVWALCELKDLIVRKSTASRKQMAQGSREDSALARCWAKPFGPFMNNVLVRLLYVMFFEICICAFLTVSYADMSSENAAGFQWFVALFAIFAVVAVFVCFTFLWFCKGPYVAGFYKPSIRHFWNSYWTVRPLSLRYEEYAVDGKGSDEIYFNGGNFIDEESEGCQSIQLRIPRHKKSKDEAMSESDDALDVKPFHCNQDDVPASSRLLLEDSEPTPRPSAQPSQIQLAPKMLKLIKDNQGEPKEVKQCQSELINDNLLLPDQNTDVRLDSLGSEDGHDDQDNTIPQIPLERDGSFDGIYDTERKLNKRETDIFEGGEVQVGEERTIMITNEDRSDLQAKNSGTFMEIDPELDKRQKRKLYLRRLSRKRQTFADEQVVTSARYDTLWLGLKKNHERNVALVHPISFLARRVAYAFLITALASHQYTNVLGFMMMSLAMLAYACYEHQWEHWLVDQQHIVNEICIYILSVFLLIFGSFIGAWGVNLGWVFIAFVCTFLVYNMIVVLRFALRTIYVIGKTIYIRHLKHRLGLGQKAKKQTKEDSLDANRDQKNRKDSIVVKSKAVSPEKVDKAVSMSDDEEKQKRLLDSDERRREQLDSACRDIEVQTDDYNGYFAKLWAWFCERFLNRSQPPHDFFMNDQNELSFGKKKEEDNDSLNSSGTFGGHKEKKSEKNEEELALKTLKLNIDEKSKLEKQQSSPSKSDIFNKSAVGDSQQNTDQQLLGHRNIPLNDSIEEELNNENTENQESLNQIVKQLQSKQTSSKHNQSGAGESSQRNSKKRQKNTSSRKKKKHTKLIEHLDPKRSINLLEKSGLSDAIEANLASHSKDLENSIDRGSVKLIKESSRNSMLLSQHDRKNLTDNKANTMPSWKRNHFSQDSIVKNNEELDENGHMIKSSKMFDSVHENTSNDGEHQRMQTIPQSEVENSQLLASGDLTGDGAQLDIRKVIPDKEDEKEDEDLDKTVLEEDAKKSKQQITLSSPKSQQVAQKWVGQSPSQRDRMGSTLRGSLDRNMSQKKKLYQSSMMKSSVQGSVMADPDFMTAEQMRATMGAKPRRRRGGLHEPTTASKERNLARLREPKKEKMPPMRYTNQGQADKQDDGTRPMLASEREHLEKELDRIHERSASESAIIHYSRLQANKLNMKDRLQARKTARAEAFKSMQSLGRRDKTDPRKTHDIRLGRFATDSKQNSEANDSIHRRNRLNRSLLSRRNRGSSSKRQAGDTSHSSLDKSRNRLSSERNSPDLKKLATISSKVNSTDGFKKSRRSSEIARHKDKKVEPQIKKQLDTSEDVQLFQSSNAELYPDNRKGLTTDSNRNESMINVDSQEEQLQVAIENAISGLPLDGGDEDGKGQAFDQEQSVMTNPDNKSRSKFDSKMLLNKQVTHGPASSILSDWDDLDGRSQSNYQHNYFYSQTKSKISKISNAASKKSNKPNDGMRSELRKRYGLGTNGRSGSKSGLGSAKQGGSFLVTGKTPQSNVTPGFIGGEKTGRSRDSRASPDPGKKHDDMISPNINNFNVKKNDPNSNPEDDLEHLIGTAAFGGIKGEESTGFPSIPEDSNHGYLGPSKATPSAYNQKSVVSKNSSSRRRLGKTGGTRTPIGNPEMYVPINLEGQMVQIMNQKGGYRPTVARNQSIGDFSVYANAFQKKLTEDKMDFVSRQKQRFDNRRVGGSVHNFQNSDLKGEFQSLEQSNSYMPKKQMTISPASKGGDQQSVSGRKALDNYLNDVPLEPSSASLLHLGRLSPQSQLKMNGNNYNFQLGGDGKMANDGHQALQSRLNQIKQSKLFQTVIDSQKDFNRSTCMAAPGDNSFTNAVATGTPYQSQNKRMSKIEDQRRGARTGLRMHQAQNLSILPDETSEGNRRDLLNGMFFPGKLSFNNSREGSVSARSQSMGSRAGSVSAQGHTNKNEDAMSHRKRLQSLNPTTTSNATSRLGANKAAGVSIVEGHGCRGKRYCSVSEMSDIGRNSATSQH